MVVDAAGNLYLTDQGNFIRKVDTNGNITTVAGTGHGGFIRGYGDGGPATHAELDYPEGVALDAAGNLFIADTGDQRIREVAASSPTAPLSGAINFTVGRKSYTADGQSFDMDVSPFISNCRTLVPVRYLADALGAQTTWDATTQKVTITRGSTTVELCIGSTTLTTNGEVSQMDVVAISTNGRAYLPARYAAEAFGFNVSWDAASQTIILSPST